MDEAKLMKIILLLMESESLNNRILKRTFHKKISCRFKGLSKNQPFAIQIIGKEGEMMLSTFGEHIGMDKSSLTYLVDDLVKKEIVYRKDDPDDRRKVLVSLTNKGLNYYDEINKITAEMADELLKYVDEADVEDYIRSLETMTRILRKIEASWNV